MGFFDKLMGGKDVELTAKSSLALAAMTMIAIDGSIEEEELSTLRRIIRGDTNAFEQAFKVFKAKSPHECVELIAQKLDQKQKMAVLANLLDIAMADGVLAGSEKDLLEKYVKSFQIRDDILKNMVDFIAIKNDFSIFK